MNISEHVDALRAALRASPATYAEVARRTGGRLSYDWVAKFAAGRMRNPTVTSLAALHDALRALGDAPLVRPDLPPTPAPAADRAA
jgi:transcriptional regulator with XRE-family HTH domain